MITHPVPTVETKAAGSITQTGATLNAMVNPNGSEVSECEFEYGTSTAYGKTAACSSLPGSGSSAVAVSAALTGLTANTTYHFRIVAANLGGSSKGTDETFKTLAEVITHPVPTVETKAAGSITQTGATLNAMVNPNGSEVSECEFEYGTSTAYGKTAACSSLPGSGSSAVAVSAALTGLTANTTYHFRIVAANLGGSSKGTDETFKTLAEVITHPVPTVETKAAGSITQTGATLNAMVNPNGSEVSECKFEYGTSTAYGKTAACSSLPGSGSSAVAVSAALTGLTANTTYHFRIVAANLGGSSKGTDETFKTLAEVITHPVPTVETKAAGSITQTGATLNAMVNPNGSEVSECEFEYGTSTAYGKTAACSSLPGSGSSAVAVSAALTGLTANTTYHFRIVAANLGGSSKGTDETFKTLAGTTNPPTLETLLHEVSSANIPHEIRSELSGLLRDALNSLNSHRGHGGYHYSDLRSSYSTGFAFGGSNELAALFTFAATLHGNCQAHQDLQQFIGLIAYDQSRRRPRIPRDLASAWTQAAGSIEASLSCRSGGQFGDDYR